MYDSLFPFFSDITMNLRLISFGVLGLFALAVILLVLVYVTLSHFHILGAFSKANDLVFDAMTDAILILDEKLHFEKANPAFYLIFPQAKGITKGMPIDHIITLPDQLHNTFHSTKQSFTTEFSHSNNGKTHYYQAGVNRIRLNNGALAGWIAVIRDNSADVAQRSKLESLVCHDTLTGIYNRRHFMMLAKQEHEKTLRDKQPYTIIIFDLDHFKNVNDTYSHKAGDAVLQAVAANVQKILRPFDLFARYGGEEFIMMVNMNEKAGVRLASRVRAVIEDSVYHFEDISIRCTASLGVAALAEGVHSLEAAIHNADLALYRAKTNGRNRVETYSENVLLSEITEAIEANCAGFRLYYQPIFSSQASTCVGAEVLLRWQSPRGVLIMPDMLIPTLEKLGQMPKVDRWILNRACETAKRWSNLFDDPDFFIHVNFSPEMLVSGSLYDEATEALARSDLPPNNLVLEFKDDYHIWEFDKGLAILKKLREENIRIAVDGFGSGHSLLSDYKNLLVDEIRIDRTFLKDIDHDSYSKNLLIGVIRMMKSVNQHICMVGVETERQKAFLQDQGVDLYQGYLWGPPVSAYQFEEDYKNRLSRI